MAGKDPNAPWQGVGGDADVILVPEECRQHGRSSRAHRAVGAWIRGIGCGDGERRPFRVAGRRGIPGTVGAVGEADGPRVQ
ncbi:MAG: hypothetical protein NVSMB27_15970 [Ktedonobacteraceae bacterium]